MAKESTAVLLERLRLEARNLNASAKERDLWYMEQLRRMDAEEEAEKKDAEVLAKQALIEKGRREAKALLYPESAGQ